MEKVIVISEIEAEIKRLRDKADQLSQSLVHIIDSGVGVEVSQIVNPFEITILPHDKNTCVEGLNLVNSNLTTLKRTDSEGIVRVYKNKVVEPKRKVKTPIQLEKEKKVIWALQMLNPERRHFKYIYEKVYGLVRDSSNTKSLTKTLNIMVEDGTLLKDTTGKAHLYSLNAKLVGIR